MNQKIPTSPETITLPYQGIGDGTVEAMVVNGMICLPWDQDGVCYITKEIAKKHFNLVDAPE